MLQTSQDEERVRRPKRKFNDQKLKALRPLLKSLAKYYKTPPGSNQKGDAGMKYRQPRWYQTLRAIFDDYETETQAKMMSLIDSSFVDEDQSDHVLTTDDAFNTSSSNNNEEEELETSDEGGSASGQDSFDFSGPQLGSKSSPFGKQK